MNINRQKVLRYLKSHHFIDILTDLQGILAPEESLSKETSSHVLKNTLSGHYKTSQLAYI